MSRLNSGHLQEQFQDTAVDGRSSIHDIFGGVSSGVDNELTTAEPGLGLIIK